MRSIRFDTLLSEIIAAEKRCVEVWRCCDTTEAHKEMAKSLQRIRQLEELAGYVARTDRLLDDEMCERILMATLERMERENGSIKDHRFDHRELHD